MMKPRNLNKVVIANTDEQDLLNELSLLAQSVSGLIHTLTRDTNKKETKKNIDIIDNTLYNTICGRMDSHSHGGRFIPHSTFHTHSHKAEPTYPPPCCSWGASMRGLIDPRTSM